jgi:hypothetical protein
MSQVECLEGNRRDKAGNMGWGEIDRFYCYGIQTSGRELWF